MREKTIKGWIVIDWKEGTHRTRKSKPGSLGTNELLAKLVPEPQVHAATLEALDDEELPDWTDTAKDRKSTRLNSSHIEPSRMPSSA